MAYEIVTDSSANLTDQMYEEYGIHVLPLRFMLDGQEFVSYEKGKQSNLKEFYDVMRQGSLYTTSLPYPDKSEETLRSILDAGNDVLYIGFSSGLSGTFEATQMIMQGLKEEYPERTLLSVDTLSAAGGQGLLVLHAAEMKQNGATIEEVHSWVEENKLKVGHWFTVDDLMFLFHGGRVSKTSAWAGTLLKIKPVLHVDDEGKLIPMQKIRGRKKSLEALFETMEQTALEPVSDQYVFISHGDCDQDVDYLEQLIEEKWHPKKIFRNILDPVIGAHTGPGLVALFFMADHR